MYRYIDRYVNIDLLIVVLYLKQDIYLSQTGLRQSWGTNAKEPDSTKFENIWKHKFFEKVEFVKKNYLGLGAESLATKMMTKF